MQRHCSLFSADKESLTAERDRNWIIAFVVKNEKRGEESLCERVYEKRKGRKREETKQRKE